jgi:transketolase
MIGDGESQEGSVWEAADIASKYKLDNLVVILDKNDLQQYGFSNQQPTLSIDHKFNAFGWNIMYVSGHSMHDIKRTFNNIKLKTYLFQKDKPTIIIAKTTKGKGISFMENEKSWHSRIPTEEEYNKAMEELNG